ncbi:hypothetical protein GGR50DRAFT_693844 [Xylaria sp. CBS 124048]|nr:hypothetical protein GGR50DRAFT_693844 [Xylaria sp. CBS 124048]
MDRDSRTDESRDRALSSEPSSTRPNPFDDDDSNLSARKRRRTSPSGSRSTSVETPLSHDNNIGASNIRDMPIDTPEPTLPSTPVRSNPPAEPASTSRVTINLRNADSLEATPTSPASPTPSRPRQSHVQPSVEAPEFDMAPVPPVDDASSSSSTLDSPDIAVISVEGLEDDVHFSTIEPRTPFRRPIELTTIVSDFPYRYDGELPHDTIIRLVAFFRQQPGNMDEGLLSIHNWVNRCLNSARFEHQATLIEVYRSYRLFWSVLPELFYQFSLRLNYAKTREIRDLVTQLLAQFAKLTAFLLNMDLYNLSQGNLTEESFVELVCPQYLRILAALPHTEEAYFANGGERNPSPLDPLEVFQSNGGASMTSLSTLVKHQTTALPRFPRIILDQLVCCCSVVQSIVRDSVLMQSSSVALAANLLERSQKNISLAFPIFRMVSDAIDLVMEKSINNLSPENANSLIFYSSDMLKHSLRGNHPEAMQRIQKYNQEHPHVPPQFLCEAAATEWRFDIYCTLIKSRQMQLRVSAATSMCDDLVAQWKKFQDRQHDPQEDTQPYLDYLRYISTYITRSGIVDYILGPTCHPEITTTSGNIVGFLGVTKTYTTEQTNLMWQTLTTTQDPRIAEALVKMMVKVTLLLQPSDIFFFVEKFQHVPVEFFTPIMRELFDNITEHLIKPIMPQPPPIGSYEVCVRLLRESSIFTSQGSIAYPDIYQFAQAKLKRLLMVGPAEDGRRDIAMSCISDVASRSVTSSGSLQVLTMVTANHVALQTFIEEHNFIQLLVDDLDAAIGFARSMGVSKVYANPFCQARRRLISSIITQFGSSIDTHLGQRLWDYLVGDKAVSYEDQKAAWDDLCISLRRRHLENQFLADCVQLFLPKLPPSCYSSGSLSFIREIVLPAANDNNGIVFDDEESLQQAGIELLWQVILASPNQHIANLAISTLVADIFVGSKIIVSYPLQRARKVHFSLVHRCLSQLKTAAQRLKAFNDGTTSNDDEPMVIVATDGQYSEQQRRFARTLQVLTSLTITLRVHPHFATPDLRPLMLSSPNAVNGDLADLKYQSFNGDEQTEIRPLKIGLQNSAASLLASIRDTTGFENFRLYYRGTTLAPSDADICKSLEELNIKNGLILVKKEHDVASSPTRIKPGASPLEIEILSYFDDLWEYLSMEENLARAVILTMPSNFAHRLMVLQIYEFLISLPANDSILAAFETAGTSPRDVFPLAQPFKSLYAIHALREYLNTRRLKFTMMRASSHEATTSKQLIEEQQNAVAKAISLIVAAICDKDIIDQCSAGELRLKLCFELVDNFIQLLKGLSYQPVISRSSCACADKKTETTDPNLLSQLLTPELHERLVEILRSGGKAPSGQIGVDLVHRCFEALLDCCTKSDEFWKIFRHQTFISEVIQTVVLADESPLVRGNIAKLINTRCLYDSSQSAVLALDFAELFWPTILQLLPQATLQPHKCEEFFALASSLMRKLIETGSSCLNLRPCIEKCGELLLSHTSTEDIAHPETRDTVAAGLISILHQGIDKITAMMHADELPELFPKRLFSKHLFPPEDAVQPLVPHVILHSPSRRMLYDVIYKLARDNQNQMSMILQSLNRLTVHQRGERGVACYQYELPQSFERAHAIRSVCGYSGLRNLSNTCYLNSLLTQLFMNVGFRGFMLSARIDKPHSQHLLRETQILFANLQDSSRRFIDPQACVDQITTYEDFPIDIHNQMDVDEFFNLLFDRWEGQFTADSDKKALRSIYGGQLVQQVKSKECEHISERIEPFSAIQCDIKGKSSLEESLQAYVDGEIMEGDNKYKCSTCDRHVDAVKRACLKDLPDNLIFHLKRFDFNLRLLQRSKINDYFPFPTKIDMQPYTVEHLSDPSGSAEPDMFELVGVLVHSGTAETGHYYSFVRERPSNRSDPTWVEFNDDIVTSWDHSQMENACFGGPDHRHYDNGNIYDKVYSAYMLFYQRSSSLRNEQETLKASGNARQLRVDVPSDLEIQVKLDNWSITQRHNLYDPVHMPFIIKVLDFCWAGKCSKEHHQENLMMEVALGHLDQVASRTKDVPDFDSLNRLIMAACRRCSLCCFAFFDYFRLNKEAFRMLLLKNSDSSVRHDAGQALLYVVRKIKTHFPDEYANVDENDESSTSSHSRSSIMETTADIFGYIWETFHTRPIAWPEYFGTMVDFARFGRLESAALLDRGFLSKVLMTIAADPVFDLPPQYSRLVNVVLRRLATRPPNYESIIALADILMDCIDTEMNYVDDTVSRLALARRDDSIPFTMDEFSTLHKVWGRAEGGVFVDKLIQLNQNLAATENIISRLVAFNGQLAALALRSVLSGITGQITTLLVTPYLRAALTFCTSSPNKSAVHRLIRHVSDQCRTIQNPEARSFFEFERDVFDRQRNTGETCDEIELHCLRNLPIWVPGLLGYLERPVSSAVEIHVREKLFKHGAVPVFAEAHGGPRRAQAVVLAARELAVNTLCHLRETYVLRAVQVSNDTMQPFHRILQQCDPYFQEHAGLDDALSRHYRELYPAVLDMMHNLTVDEIEDDGSDWEQSVGSSESLADLSNMQVDQELMDGST